ncbi:MAG: SUMF1/EgtB/PvdO family nonheme iron enzyme [Anaerolineae bacterium]|nr:SUMF1/EgtB/PvdO family nonheme iron enzyme [Anaerolineae bacterium]
MGAKMNRPLAILSDRPADQDRLGFGPYAKTLTDIVTNPNTDTPLTIGVFGGWGRGKTSLMQMVLRRLQAAQGEAFPVRTAWFNAWLYSREQALWRALVSSVLEAVRQFPTLDAPARQNLQRLESRLYSVALPAGGQLTVGPGTIPGLEGASLPALVGLELLRRQAERRGDDARGWQQLVADVETSEALAHRDQIVALDHFRREFEAISARYITPHGRLVIFIDDLDRCLPDKAVEVLEALKLFLDVPGCVFVLGVDSAVIEEGVRVRYSEYKIEIEGSLYLEKIIQIPFNLPPIPPAAVKQYVREVTGNLLPDQRCETVFSVGLEPNPRRIKRTLNIFLLLWQLAQNREDLCQAIMPVRLAKMVIIQQYYPGLFALLTRGPHHLIDLERRFRQGVDEPGAPEAPPHDAVPTARTTEEGISAGPLAGFVNRGLLHDLLTCTDAAEADANFIDLTPAGVLEYVYLTRSTVEERAVEAEAAQLPFEPQMVTIPAGPFLMGTRPGEADELVRIGLVRDWVEREIPQGEVTLPAYAISRYPITNAEFARFITDGGYENTDYWSEAGWRHREKERWGQPRYWDVARWNDPSQPVVGVSWYEALAYCRWLSAKTGREYRLPTEAEWEKAARGRDGRRYPWAGEWDPSRCNNKTSGPGCTTPVGQYPTGDSVYGVGDMVGQVWEWCSSNYASYPYSADDGREDLETDAPRILRGGSWWNDNPPGVCRCAFRFWDSPWYWNFSRGFRCVRGLER